MDINCLPIMNVGMSGGALRVPDVLSDGNTMLGIDYLTGVAKDGGNLVSQWDDLYQEGNDLLQATPLDKPLWTVDEIIFNGIRQFMACVPFTLAQPTQIYAVLRQKTWTVNDWLWDGNTANSGALFQSGSTPNVRIRAASTLAQNGNLTLDTFMIVRALYNGASSSLQINETTKITGDIGAGSMSGFYLGSQGGGTFGWSNIGVKGLFLRKIADAAEDELAIFNYLKGKYSIPT